MQGWGWKKAESLKPFLRHKDFTFTKNSGQTVAVLGLHVRHTKVEASDQGPDGVQPAAPDP